MSAGFEVVHLKGGASAIRCRSSGEVMHPAVGPWAEANALYVEQAELARRLQEPGPPLVVYDVGLGAAANALAAAACAAGLGSAARRPLELVSFERDLEPLRLAVADEAGFPYLSGWRPQVDQLLEGGQALATNVRWRLRLGDFLEQLSHEPARAEVVFFDPFSPRANPQLWTPESLAQVRGRCSDRGAVLMTYSAATPTRVSLLLAGFYVGAGRAIGYKAETTAAATDRQLLAAPLDARWLMRWERSTAAAPHGWEDSPQLRERVRTHPQFCEAP